MADEDVSLHRQCWKYVNTVQLQHITETSHFPNIIIRQNQYFNQMSFHLLVQIIFLKFVYETLIYKNVCKTKYRYITIILILIKCSPNIQNCTGQS